MHSLRLNFKTIPGLFRPLQVPSTIQKSAYLGAFLLVELTSIVAATIFLNYLQSTFLIPQIKFSPVKLSHQEIAMHVMESPLIEEILFRGILLRGLHGVQLVWNRCIYKKCTDIGKIQQKNIRITLMALLWGCSHFKNSKLEIRHQLKQVSWSFIGGLAYGHLSEKYNTLSLGYLLHGLNNAMCLASSLYPQYYKTLRMIVYFQPLAISIF